MRKRDNQRQDGFVAIIVALLVMVIIGLITIGFTRVMQREQRQALDRQLSRQALYAAESGINDVYSAITSSTPPFNATNKTTCDVSGLTDPLPPAGVVDVESGIEYTCILYNKAPGEIKYDTAANISELSHLKNSIAFDSLTYTWGNSDPSKNNLVDCGEAGDFPANRAGYVPILKIDLTNTTNLQRDALASNTQYLYLSPCTGAGSTTRLFSNLDRGVVVPVNCSRSGDQTCSFTISGLGSTSYLSRIKTIYDSASVSISGISNSSPVAFADVQIDIDVTAKANDVVRRLKAAIPISFAPNAPEGVLHTFNGVCKLLDVVDPVGTTPGTIQDNC